MLDFIKNLIFRKKCPKVHCTVCKYYYAGPDHMRRCRLIEQLHMND